MAKGKTIRDSLRPVLLYSRLTGIYPSRSHAMTFRLYAFVMFSFLFINTIVNVIFQYFRTDISPYTQTLTSFYSLLNFCYAIGYLHSSLHSHMVKKLIETLTGIGHDLEKKGLPFRTKRRIQTHMMVRVPLVLTSLIPKINRLFVKPPAQMGMMVHSVSLYAFEGFINLSTQFQLIALFTCTGELSDFITAKLIDHGNLSSRSDAKGKLRAVMRNHMKITRLCRQLDSAYGFHFLISITSTFLQLTIDCANFVFLQRNQEARGMSGVIYFVMETSYLIATLVYDIEPPVRLQQKVAQFTEKLMELYLSNRVGILHLNRTVEIILNDSLRISFSAKKFFVINETLFLSMAGSVTSFMIILVQFSE